MLDKGPLRRKVQDCNIVAPTIDSSLAPNPMAKPSFTFNNENTITV